MPRDPGKQLEGLALWRRLALAALFGVVMASGQAPLGIEQLGFVGLVMGLALAHGATRPGLVGWVFGAGYFAATLHWIVEPFMVDFARHGWMAPFALIGMSGGLALFWLVAFRVGARLGAGALGIAVMLAAAELARGYVFTGFPWGLVGYIWLDTPAIQWVAWVGPYGLTFLTLVCAAVIAQVVTRPLRPTRVVLGALPLFALIVVGDLRPTTLPSYTGANVRIVQPNAPQHLKWKEDWIGVFFQRQLELSSAGSGPPPDLVIWPEASVAYDLGPGSAARAAMLDASGGAPVIAGHLVWEGGDTFNALSVLRDVNGDAARYEKHHLVPFGEYIPLGEWLLKYGINGLAANPGAAFSAGTGAKVMSAGEIAGRFKPLICYEAVFPQHARTQGARADWLLHLTNDAWFGALAGPYQHLAQARIRAIEQGLPVLRAANTGISAVISPYGDILASLPLDKAGKIDATIPPPLPPTPYGKTGDLPFSVVLATLVGLLLLRRRGITD